MSVLGYVRARALFSFMVFLSSLCAYTLYSRQVDMSTYMQSTSNDEFNHYSGLLFLHHDVPSPNPVTISYTIGTEFGFIKAQTHYSGVAG